MTPAQRDYRARVFAEVNRRALRRKPPLAGLSSIVWGTRTRTMGFFSPSLATDSVMQGPVSQGLVAPHTQIITGIPFPGNPDTLPGAWPGLAPTTAPTVSATVAATGLPGQEPIVVTPTSGPIPSPATVAAGTTAPASWLDGSLIGGIANKYLLLAGVGAFLFFGGKKK